MSQPIDWPGIRASAVALQSVREAAMRAASNLPSDEARRFVERVNKRAYRERWLDHAKALAKPRDNGSLPLSKPVQSGADSLQDALLEHGNATKLALSTAARRGAEHLAKARPAAILKRHHALRNVTAAAAQLHGWDSGKGGTHVSLNLLSIGGDMIVNPS